MGNHQVEWGNMGKSTISMAIFNGYIYIYTVQYIIYIYVGLPEGTFFLEQNMKQLIKQTEYMEIPHVIIQYVCST